MITCNKCKGRVFVDRTFGYETFCLICGKRDYIHPRHPLFKMIDKAEKEFAKTA